MAASMRGPTPVNKGSNFLATLGLWAMRGTRFLRALLLQITGGILFSEAL